MTNARHTLAALATAAAALIATSAQAAADFSGLWMPKGEPRVPQAASTPAAAARVAELLAARGVEAPKGSPAYAWKFCAPEGVPWQMTHRLPIDIRQGPLTVSMMFAVEADPRHIYINGQRRPSENEFDFTTVGYSWGRWAGDVLVADTRYFANGVEVIPGGALRTEKSRLVERIQLVDRDTLRITSTWTDPTTLRRPHTYVYEFSRVAEPAWLPQSQCNPIQAMRAKGIPLPIDAPQF